MNKNILLVIIIALAVHVLLTSMIAYKEVSKEEGLKKKFVLASIGIAVLAIIGAFVSMFMMGGNSSNQASTPVPSPSPAPTPGAVVDTLRNKNRVN